MSRLNAAEIKMAVLAIDNYALGFEDDVQRWERLVEDGQAAEMNQRYIDIAQGQLALLYSARDKLIERRIALLRRGQGGR